ncbi:MAG: hypothetical protein J6U96_01605 [Elusimicrobiaceae bacterium]|nr:hypothetical protein [Elusimicrobiaceae bacterium]
MNVKNLLPQILASTKQGLLDIKTVLEEGQYKLFLKPVIVLFVLFIVFRYANGLLESRDRRIMEQIDAVHAQQNNEQEYLSNKEKLLVLEPRFPDMSTKKDSWLLNQVVNIFKENSNITPKVAPTPQEDTSNNGYTVMSVPVDMNISYGDLGRLLASIEGREEFLKVSEFTLSKTANDLGQNNVKMRINTVFPTENVSKALFKDTVTKGGKK